MNNERTALVVTSIAHPTECMRRLAEGARERVVPFYCVGDVPSPADFNLSGCEFLPIEAQRELPFQYAGIAPERHYARKNIGYLVAISRGAQWLLETDDDNCPLDAFWDMASGWSYGHIEGSGWYNVYEWFKTDAWPRGFPLEHVLSANEEFQVRDTQTLRPLVWQGLVSGEPDVDAIYRLTRKDPARFATNTPLVLGRNVWSPFNSQNTLWSRAAFPLLYLPATCSFRATDIIRGYVALRSLWELDASIAFLPPTAVQERNEHDLMRDFADEIEIYTRAGKIARTLETLALEAGQQSVTKNLICCYEALAEMEAVKAHELDFVRSWCADMASLGLAQ